MKPAARLHTLLFATDSYYIKQHSMGCIYIQTQKHQYNTHTHTLMYTFQTYLREQHYLSNLADNHSFYHLIGFPAVTQSFFLPQLLIISPSFFFLGLPPSLFFFNNLICIAHPLPPCAHPRHYFGHIFACAFFFSSLLGLLQLLKML